jgi:HlyD family secretion protein
MKRARLIVLLAVVLACAGIFLVATGRIGKNAPPADLLTLYGNVDIRQVELGFRVPGRVKSMAFEEGQAVSAGDVMAALDPQSYEDALRAARAQVAAQGATLQKAKAGNRPAEILRAAAAVDEATAVQQNARNELERTRRLVADNTLPPSNLDNALAASRAADARVASAKETHRLLVQGSRSEDIAAALGMFQVAEAQVASAQTALDDTRLIAPSDGVVTSRVREPGAIVSPNDVVYVLSLTRTVWVRAYVSEVELGRLRPGMEVTVVSDAAPAHPSKGHIGFISPVAEFTPKSVETPSLRTDLVYRLRIIVDEPESGLRQGMPVTVHIPTLGHGA